MTIAFHFALAAFVVISSATAAVIANERVELEGVRLEVQVITSPNSWWLGAEVVCTVTNSSATALPFASSIGVNGVILELFDREGQRIGLAKEGLGFLPFPEHLVLGGRKGELRNGRQIIVQRRLLTVFDVNFPGGHLLKVRWRPSLSTEIPDWRVEIRLPSMIQSLKEANQSAR